MIRTALIPTVPAIAAIAQPALADWAGVAVNAEVGQYGYSLRWTSSQEAGAKALGFCRDFSNNQEGCEVVMTTDRCGGIARGYENFAAKYFVAEAGGRTAAGDQALSDCQEAIDGSCELVRNFCADDR